MKKKISIEELILAHSEKTDKQYQDLDRRLDNIEKVMIVQEINLKDHMKRSDNLESIIQAIQDEDLKPLHKHVNTVEGALKLLGILSIVIGIATGILSLFGVV